MPDLTFTPTPKKSTKDSKYEDLLASQLDSAGIQYFREFSFHDKRRWRADFYIPAGKICVEVEGISYRGQGGRHQTGAGFQADCVKYNEMAIAGYRLLRFTPAMVSGKARTGLKKGPERLEPAITTILRYIDAYEST